MKKLKRVFCILAIAFLVVGSMALTLEAAQSGTPQKNCPVLDNPINKKIYTDYKGKRIYFCCTICRKQFAKDPGKYLKKLQDEGVSVAKAPAAK